MITSEVWELLSYVVTVIGLPMAIGVFIYEQRRERLNEEDAVHQMLFDNYQEFLRVVVDNPDLHLFAQARTPALDDMQRERMMVILGMLVSLFERAYVLLYSPRLKGQKLRRWASWQDYMSEWCAREDFRESLAVLLVGEDPEFCRYLLAMVQQSLNQQESTVPSST